MRKPVTMSGRKTYLTEIDIIRSFMILWIFIAHFYEHFEEGGMFGNPGPNWASLTERFHQLIPLPYEGLPSVGQNLYRYLGLSGDQGVQVFLLISGFVLAYGFMNSDAGKIDLRSFFKRRVLRIYPAWILCHLVLVLSWIVIDTGMSPFSPNTWLSMLGIRILPQIMYFGSPAWWFIGCLLQLYILFPFLYTYTIGQNKEKRLLGVIVVSLLIRLAGLILSNHFAPHLLDYWSRGIIFISRLPEFAAGIYLAVQYKRNPDGFIHFIKSAKGLSISFLIWISGTLSAFFLSGMAITFFLTAVGAFLFLWGALLHFKIRAQGALQRFSTISYEFYLVHQLVIATLIPTILSAAYGSLRYFLLAFFCSLILAWALGSLSQNKRIKNTFQALFDALLEYKIKAAAILFSAYLLCIGFEIIVQYTDPREVNGWGERPALQPDPQLGYRLIPNQTTRLRWQSYNYEVVANSLGFPGPEYPVEKDTGIFRILVTGDAFESAEGVDTKKSWPRQLEMILNEKFTRPVFEILNFSITGWGPQHYERAIARYAPVYDPDLVIIGLFINDLTDVFLSDKDFADAIGFNEPMPFSIPSTLSLNHLESFVSYRANRTVSRISKKITPKDYYLGHPGSILKSSESKLMEGANIAAKHLKNIKQLEDEYATSVIAVLIPSSIQSADASELQYLPKDVDYSDTAAYDMNLPQRLLMDMCDSLSIPYLDCRVLFTKISGKGVYQPANMHWTEYGHRMTAEWLAEELSSREGSVQFLLHAVVCRPPK